jgi:peptide/nickel transport system substrate-binding protein
MKVNRRSTVRAVRVLSVATLATFGALVSAGSSASASRPSSGVVSSAPKSGGTLTVLETGGTWPTGLDPGTSTTAGGDMTENDAIFGELFELGPGSKTIDDLAAGYQLSSDAKTLTIDLRHGVTFSDGTPFNSAAVAFNLRRDLKSNSGGGPSWSVSSIDTPDDYTVVVHLAAPDGAIVDQFQGSTVNWIASPTALSKMGEKAFSVAPVGAGPFEVVSDTLSSKLVLKRNPLYWQKGLPYLDGLVFESVASDETALEDLQSGGGQASEAMGTPGLVNTYKSAGFTVTPEESTAPYLIELDTTTAPFNNIKAREAIYYATDSSVLNQRLFGSLYPLTESFTASSGLFYDPDVPGYRTYDLSKAKALVQQVGGISFNLFALSTGENVEFLETLQTMYESAGMKVTLSPDSLDALIQTFGAKKWQASLESYGSWDPAAQHGVSFGFAPPSPFTGVDDPHLTTLLNQAEAAASPSTRGKLYAQAADYISQQAYAPFLFPLASWNIAAKGVEGPGLTTSTLPVADEDPSILWENVSMNNNS